MKNNFENNQGPKIDLEEWDRQTKEKIKLEKELTVKLKEICLELGLGEIDPDGAMRFKDYADAYALQGLAKQKGLEVKIIEPSIEDLKAKRWLGDMFVVRPVKFL